jgi:PAS domain S-box-containing protein
MIEVGIGAGFPDSFFALEMKDYRKMSKAELLAWIHQLRSRHATRTRAQRQRANTALGDSAERLRAILETAVEGIITIDERGIIESFNLAAERIFGYPARRSSGKTSASSCRRRIASNTIHYLGNYLRTGHAKIIGIGREIVGRRKNGTVFPMDLSVSEVRLADRRLFTGFTGHHPAQGGGKGAHPRHHRAQAARKGDPGNQRARTRRGASDIDLHDGLCQHLAGQH